MGNFYGYDPMAGVNARNQLRATLGAQAIQSTAQLISSIGAVVDKQSEKKNSIANLGAYQAYQKSMNNPEFQQKLQDAGIKPEEAQLPPPQRGQSHEEYAAVIQSWSDNLKSRVDASQSQLQQQGQDMLATAAPTYGQDKFGTPTPTAPGVSQVIQRPPTQTTSDQLAMGADETPVGLAKKAAKHNCDALAAMPNNPRYQKGLNEAIANLNDATDQERKHKEKIDELAITNLNKAIDAGHKIHGPVTAEHPDGIYDYLPPEAYDNIRQWSATSTMPVKQSVQNVNVNGNGSGSGKDDAIKSLHAAVATYQMAKNKGTDAYGTPITTNVAELGIRTAALAYKRYLLRMGMKDAEAQAEVQGYLDASGVGSATATPATPPTVPVPQPYTPPTGSRVTHGGVTITSVQRK